ncbi:MAG: hypothetical protein AB1659_13780, partial [Thermodesulfobacteriota bacterium]
MTKLHKSIFNAALITVLGIIPALLICSCEKEKTKGFPSKKQQIRLGYVEQVISGLIILGMDKGYFEQEGLEVTATKYPTGTVAI